MNHGDPTDHALAAIASLHDRPAEKPETERSDVEALADQLSDPRSETVAEVLAEISADAPAKEPEVDDDPEPVELVATEPTLVPEIDVDTYTRSGPGPLDALRFRWSTRRDDSGAYFVDETIGPNSRPITTGPMPRDQVVDFIDAQEADARRRFAELKNEMTLRVPVMRSFDESEQ